MDAAVSQLFIHFFLFCQSPKAHKTAHKLHAHSVLYAHKLTTTRRALEKSSCSQDPGLEQGAA